MKAFDAPLVTPNLFDATGPATEFPDFAQTELSSVRERAASQDTPWQHYRCEAGAFDVAAVYDRRLYTFRPEAC